VSPGALLAEDTTRYEEILTSGRDSFRKVRKRFTNYFLFCLVEQEKIISALQLCNMKELRTLFLLRLSSSKFQKGTSYRPFSASGSLNFSCVFDISSYFEAKSSKRLLGEQKNRQQSISSKILHRKLLSGRFDNAA
jgi:hypothetical protein